MTWRRDGMVTLLTGSYRRRLPMPIPPGVSDDRRPGRGRGLLFRERLLHGRRLPKVSGTVFGAAVLVEPIPEADPVLPDRSCPDLAVLAQRPGHEQDCNFQCVWRGRRALARQYHPA